MSLKSNLFSFKFSTVHYKTKDLVKKIKFYPWNSLIIAQILSFTAVLVFIKIHVLVTLSINYTA